MYNLPFDADEAPVLLQALAAHSRPLADRVRAAVKPPTNTVGGGRDQTAIIGHAPEHADWSPGDPVYPPVIHPTARIEALVTVDAGLERPTRIGARTWLLKNGTHVGHDADIGEDCVIACGAKIGGHVTIGNGAFVGLGAVIAPYRTIGAGAQVEAGAVVIHDVPAGARVGGNPARILPPRRKDRFTDRDQAARTADQLPGFEGEEHAAAPAAPTAAGDAA